MGELVRGVDVPVSGPAAGVGADLCARVHPSRQEAVAVARRLRTAGWIVRLLDVPSGVRPDGTRVVATVYHPDTYQSPGEVVYADPQ